MVFTEEGENIITITALTKTVEYSIYYEKAEPGDIVGQAVFSLEAFSIGGGYIIEPCFVDIIEGENSAHMLKRVLEENGFGMTYTGTIENSFYLSAITGSALAEIDPTGDSIPQELRSKLKSIKPRTNVNRLGEFDYTSGSGWMYCINGKFPNVSFAASYLSDDDVVRVQFTIALGSDIGGGMATAIGGSSYYEIADKDELTTLMAQLGMEKVPQNVLDIATKVNATQDEADSAVAKLKEIANGYYKNDANQKTEFTDIEGHWAEEAINEVVDLGLFNGVGDNRFDPDGTMTRAMFATTIYRFANAKATGINKFSDVPNDTWYTDAVIWCNDNKIVEGTGNGFEPEENITREQIAVMFYRYAKMMQIDTTARGDINKFNDCGEISDWAKEAVEWAVGIGLLEGRTLNTLVPQGEATRAEVATIYLRLIAFMAK